MAGKESKMKALNITIRVVLDPDEVDNARENGATDDDIKREIKEHLSSAVGNRNIIYAGYILEAEILDVNKED